MSCEVPKKGNMSDSQQGGNALVGVESDFRVDKEDKIPFAYKDYQNFVDAATFMACQDERSKMHPASPDKD